MTPRNVYFARRIAVMLALVAIVALIVLFVPRACGALLGSGDEQAEFSENAALDEQPARKDDRPVGGPTAERNPTAVGTSGEKAEDDGAGEGLVPPDDDRNSGTGTGATSDGTDDEPKDDVGNGGEKSSEREGEAADADEGEQRDDGQPATKEQDPDEFVMANAQAGAQDKVVPSPPVPAEVVYVPAEPAPVTLDQDIAAVSAAATAPERYLERRRERRGARRASWRNAGDAPRAAASVAVAPRDNTPARDYDSDTYADPTGAARGRADAAASATRGGDASASAAAYVGKGHRARTRTSAHSKAVLGKGQRRAEASSYSRARMRTTAPDGTTSWSRSWSYHSSWATSSR